MRRYCAAFDGDPILEEGLDEAGAGAVDGFLVDWTEKHKLDPPSEGSWQSNLPVTYKV